MVVEAYRKPNPLGDIITGIVLFYWLGQSFLYLLGVKKFSGGASLGAAIFVIAGFITIGIVINFIAKVRDRTGLIRLKGMQPWKSRKKKKTNLNNYETAWR
jgi:hypothetical protein